MKLIVRISLIFIVISIGCKKEDEIINLDTAKFVDFGSCFLEFRIDDEVLIIKDSANYAELEDLLRNPWNPLDFTDSCSSAHLPEVDFAKSFVVCKKTMGNGCEAVYYRSIKYNKTQESYSYTIDVNYSGDCVNPEIISYNWAIIPKMDAKYAIIFEVI